MQELSLAIVLTSQGIPFLHAGTELLRNKKGVENSFNAGDSINKINWSWKSKNIATFNLVQQLIKMRKSHPAFRMTTNQLMSKNISFSEDSPAGVIAYAINGAAVKDSWKKIFVVFNGSAETKEINLPKGKWNIAIDTNKEVKISSGIISVQKYGAAVLYQ